VDESLRQGEIIVTHRGNKTGAIRKPPLMRVKDGANYILVGSVGGAPANPVWVYNLRAKPTVAVAAFPSYEEYQAKTTRRIPVFVAEPARE